MTQPRMRLSAAVLGAPDARALAAFYEQLLGWTRVADEPGWVMLRPPSGGTGLSFQSEPDFVPPVWPSVPGAQQIMTHLDIAVEDLEAGVAWARKRARGSPTSSRRSTFGSCSTRSGIHSVFPRPRLTARHAQRGAPTAFACMQRGPWGTWQCSARLLKTVSWGAC